MIEPPPPVPVVLSKKQQKRNAKAERWLEIRKMKRKLERERRKERKAAQPASSMVVVQRQITTMAESQCRIRVAIDMAFDDLMSERDVRKCLSQIGFCYAANRRAANPLQLSIVNFVGVSRKIFDSNNTNKHWDVNLTNDPLITAFDPADIVYLSSESPNELASIDANCVYVIGGLVDHNQHKGVCLRAAESAGIRHARLPIDRYVAMKTRKVLTVNQVFEILLRFSEVNDWKRAFFAAIPKRKGVVDRDDDDCDGPDSSSNHNNDDDRDESERPVDAPPII